MTETEADARWAAAVAAIDELRKKLEEFELKVNRPVVPEKKP